MKTVKKISGCLLLILVLFHPLKAQNKKDSVAETAPAMVLNYLCTSNDSIILTVSISVRRDEGLFGLENALVEFTAGSGPEIRLLGTVKTDATGDAMLKVAIKTGLPLNKEGKISYTAKFPKQGKYLETSQTFEAKLAKILVSFTKDDSLRTIHVNATQIEFNGGFKPIPKENVIVYVPRMLSNLKIGEVALDENGTGTLEYPGQLVGDSLGNIVILAKIEENDLFGNVQGKSIVQWGIPKQYYLAEKPTRELWTPIAPIWMIITLIIMLTGVWTHYIYAVIQLILIKRSSKEKKNYF